MSTSNWKVKTISDVKRIAENHGSFFFSRDTMKFFGDTMKNLGVRKINSEIYVYRKRGRKAVWQFNPDTGDFTSCTDEMSRKIY